MGARRPKEEEGATKKKQPSAKKKFSKPSELVAPVHGYNLTRRVRIPTSPSLCSVKTAHAKLPLVAQTSTSRAWKGSPSGPFIFLTKHTFYFSLAHPARRLSMRVV